MQYTWALMSASMRETYLGISEDCLLRLISYRTIGRWYWEAKDETGDFLYSYGDNYKTLAEAQAAAVQWVRRITAGIGMIGDGSARHMGRAR